MAASSPRGAVSPRQITASDFDRILRTVGCCTALLCLLCNAAAAAARSDERRRA
eukprot:COSAG01_NODE_1851_length_9062_cov_44.766819_6_plen_54_part_00